MAITQRVKLGQWNKVYNRRKRMIGEWAVVKGEKGFTYSGYTYDKTGEVEWDLCGRNPEYPTAIEAAKAALENVLIPSL